ncbi:MAG: FKBP-type peptidyl-prolyl cis-trans isomerase [Chromatiales bacterium]|jgi:FKBP-type peptidyl-prolyl cis-trans isomerase SlyD
MTQKIEPGKYVSLTYVIKDETGSLLEQNDIPVGYVFGGDTELLGGMDKIMLGKTAGEEVVAEFPPEKGFGDKDPSLIFTDELENVPEQYRFVGAEVQMQNAEGETKTFYVSKIENGKLTVDGNHPLAGKTLSLSVKILEVRDSTEEDIMTSGIHSTDLKSLN